MQQLFNAAWHLSTRASPCSAPHRLGHQTPMRQPRQARAEDMRPLHPRLPRVHCQPCPLSYHSTLLLLSTSSVFHIGPCNRNRQPPTSPQLGYLQSAISQASTSY